MTDESPQWEPDPPPDTMRPFVFLSVDVIGHSKLVEEAEKLRGYKRDRRLRELHWVLVGLEDLVNEHAHNPDGRLTWDWAGDGGLLAFPLPETFSDPESAAQRATVQRVLEVAKTIARDLERFNETIAKRRIQQSLSLRLVVHIGEALYTTLPHRRRSAALNTVAKLRFPSDRTSLTITADVLDELQGIQQLRGEFVLLDGLVDPVAARRTYGHAPTLLCGLEDAIAASTSRRFKARAGYERAMLLCAADRLPEARAALEETRKLLAERAAAPEVFWYRRCWVRFLQLWEDAFATEGVAMPKAEDRSPQSVRLAYLRSEEVTSRLKENCGPSAALLMDMEFMLAQTLMLSQRYVDTPFGLSTLQVCRLLLRAGHSPTEPPVAARLDRIVEDMKREPTRATIDGECSLCTGTAVSCLALADRIDDVRPSASWLATLEKDRYVHLAAVYTKAKSDQHALHYAAAVLEAFCDLPTDETSRERIDSVLGVLMSRNRANDRAPLKEWMLYRNESELELFAQILAAILRGRLGDRLECGPSDVRRLRIAIGQLVKTLDKEVSRTKQGANLYAIRENIASFALGALLGSRQVTSYRAKAVEILQHRARKATEEDAVGYRRTLDSSVERCCTMVEGWLCHWEVELLDSIPDETARPRPRGRAARGKLE